MQDVVRKADPRMIRPFVLCGTHADKMERVGGGNLRSTIERTSNPSECAVCMYAGGRLGKERQDAPIRV